MSVRKMCRLKITAPKQITANMNDARLSKEEIKKCRFCLIIRIKVDYAEFKM